MNKYKYIIVPLICLIIGQLTKFVGTSIKEKKLRWDRLFNGSGGMPSSHSTLSCSLLFMIAFNEGADSIFFAIALVVFLIVAYDAMGVRLETGKQSKTINKMVKELIKSTEDYQPLKEGIGHEPLEVLAGIILALIVSLIYTFVIL